MKFIVKYRISRFCLIVALCASIQNQSHSAVDPEARQEAIELAKEAQDAYQQGRFQSAVSRSKAAVRRDSTYARSYLWMGAAYVKLGQMLLAQSAYELAVLNAPNSVEGRAAVNWLRKHSTFRPTTQGTPGGKSMQRIERSVLDLRPVEGDWSSQRKRPTIAGRVFDQAGLLTSKRSRNGTYMIEKVVFLNAKFNRFEAWIGKRGGTGEGSNQFQVLGDGKVLYTSPPLGEDDPAIKISVPISGYSGVTLIALSDETNRAYYSAAWANPMFVKFY